MTTAETPEDTPAAAPKVLGQDEIAAIYARRREKAKHEDQARAAGVQNGRPIRAEDLGL